MATKSFYQNMEIKTEEQVQILLRLFEEADNRPYTPPEIDIDEVLKEGIKWAREGGIDKVLATIREKKVANEEKKDLMPE